MAKWALSENHLYVILFIGQRVYSQGRATILLFVYLKGLNLDELIVSVN